MLVEEEDILDKIENELEETEEDRIIFTDESGIKSSVDQSISIDADLDLDFNKAIDNAIDKAKKDDENKK